MTTYSLKAFEPQWNTYSIQLAGTSGTSHMIAAGFVWRNITGGTTVFADYVQMSLNKIRY